MIKEKIRFIRIDIWVSVSYDMGTRLLYFLFRADEAEGRILYETQFNEMV